MNLRSRLGAAVVALTGKSFSASARAWARGDDVVDGRSEALTQPYRQSAWIRAAINHVAGEISGRPLCFYDGETEFEESAFAEWWSAPALGPKTLGATQPRLSRAQALRDLATWAKLEGEFFIVLDDAWLLYGASRNPAALSPFLIARPDRMRQIVRAGVLEAWEYIDAGGHRFVFLPQQVKHWKGFNPYDDWRGVGELQAALVPAESAFYTGAYIRNLMRNNGDQGYIVIGKNGVADDAQREQIVAQLRAKRAFQQRGVAKDLFLTGEIEVDRPKEQSAGSEVIAGKGLSHQEIFVAFGVPPSMAEVKASYSIGKDSDYYQLITRTCQPLGGEIAGVLGEVGSIMAGRKLSAELDWDDHPVMVEVRNSRVDALAKVWGMGMPVKAANDWLGLGMKPFPGWEVGYLPFSAAPVSPGDTALSPSNGPSEDPAVDPTLAENPPEEDPAVSQLRLALLTRRRSMQCRTVAATKADESFAMFACACHSTAGVAMKDRSPSEVAHWRTLMAKRRATVKAFESAFTRVLMQARVEMLKKIETGYTPIPKSADPATRNSEPGTLNLAKRSAAADFLFDLARLAVSFRGAMENQQKTAVQTAGEQLLAELEKDDVFRMPPQRLAEYLAARQNKLSSVPQEIYDRIKVELQAGIDAGETADQLAGRVKSTCNDISDGMARRIGLTETGAAYGVSRDAAMRQSGVQWKRWLTSGNANVRAAHAVANGQVVPLDEEFTVDGELLRFPGDDGGSAGNVINCHCVSIAAASGPAE